MTTDDVQVHLCELPSSLRGVVLGELPPTVGLSLDYLMERGIFLDCRGPLVIHPTSNWSFQIMVITTSHEIGNGQWGPVIPRPVIVDEWAWIGSRALLFNCCIGAHAIVQPGTVVHSVDVAPWTMVAGNPARVVARFVDGRWQYIAERQKVLE